MNRKEEMNEFIKSLAHQFQQRKPLMYTGEVINALKSYDYTNDELLINNIRDKFVKWFDHFKNDTKIKISDKSNPGFLTFFINNRVYSRNIKLYISLNPEAIEEGVNQIIEFLSNNNLACMAKVSRELRNDCITLRLNDSASVEKFISFINNNQFFMNNFRKTHPFLNRDGVVGLAYDDRLSYTSTLSYFLSLYFQQRERTNDLERCSIDDFSYYMNDAYNKIFVDRSLQGWFENTSEFQINHKRIDEAVGRTSDSRAYTLNNYREVMEAILTSVNQKDYREIYAIASGNHTTFDSAKKILDSYIKYAYVKYHDIEAVIRQLELYTRGIEAAITRDNGYRDMFHYQISPEILLTMTNSEIDKYVKATLSQKQDMEPKTYSGEFRMMFIEGCRETYAKGGYDGLYNLIRHVFSGDFSNMSNENGYRSYFENMDKVTLSKSIGGLCHDLFDEFQIDLFGQVTDQLTEDLIITYKFQERKASI